ENQKIENPHDELPPERSAAIVRRHVADGLELARQYRLPRAVADFVSQHHGTRAVGLFWQKARAQAAERGIPLPDEGLFRYPGPPPQTRETALVMLADSCEAAARRLDDPTPERFEALVQRLFNQVASEGQLDACDLTLED